MFKTPDQESGHFQFSIIHSQFVFMSEQLLTIEEVAAWLKIKKCGVRQLMRRNHLRRGVHYVRPPGLSTRFKEKAIAEWLDEREQKNAESDSSIKMVKGYRMK